MRFIHALLYKLVELFLKRNKLIEFVGPVAHTNPAAEELQEFRDTILRSSAPYLFNPEVQDREKSITLNERSYHFGIKFKGKITAYVRLTPAQFELTTLNHSWDKVATRYQDFIEFNRLVGDPSIEKRGYFARLLLLYVGLWLFSKSNYKGIIATCREERLSFLTSFGLSSVYGLESYLTERKGQYHLLAGTKREILREIFKKYLTNNRMFNSEYKRSVN